MRKILLITLDFPPLLGGVASYYHNLMLNLHKIGFKIMVLTSPHPKGEKFDLKQPYKIVRRNLLASYFYPKWLLMFPYILKAIFKFKPDVIWVGQILPVGLPVLILSRLFKIPYWVLTHGMDIKLPQKNKRKFKILKIVLKHSKRCIANSQFTKKELEKLAFPSSKISIIYPCPDQDIKIKEKEVEKIKSHLKLRDKKIITSISRLVKRKGHYFIILALRKVMNQYPNLTYLIIGSGPEEDNLKDLVNKLNIKDKVYFLKAPEPYDIYPYLFLTDIFILAPYEINGDIEGFGLSFLEANLFKKPVIATRTGGVAEAVIHYHTGILVEPKNIDQLASALLKLLKDDKLAQKLGHQGFKRVKEEFNWSHQIKKIIPILYEV